MAYFKGSNDRGGDRAPRGGGRGGFRSGGRPPFRSSNRGDRPELFDATCADCGKETLVPFRPGDRPVYCRECFAKRGGGEERGREAGSRNGHEKFVKRPKQEVSQNPPIDISGLKLELEAVNTKLDKLISVVESLATKPAKKVAKK